MPLVSEATDTVDVPVVARVIVTPPITSVTVFEAEARLGGHARTILAGRRGDQPVDTGFIVFNKVNYPHLTRLFDRLEVPYVPSEMSFGASFGGGRMEYALGSLDQLFDRSGPVQ